MPPSQRTIAVVGGGISGLAAAWALTGGRGEGGTPADGTGAGGGGGTPAVVLFEAGDRLGGRIETVPFLGRPLDAGADAFVTRSPAGVELCRELGLEDELLAPAAGKASLWFGGALYPLPSGLVLGVPTDLRALRRSGLLTARGWLRAALGLALPGKLLLGGMRRRDSDPSVAEVLGRLLGRQALRTLVDPLIGGINAGVTDQLSLAAAVPQLASAQRGGRVLRRALVAGARPRARPGTPAGTPADVPRPPVFLGLAGGLGTLVERLSEELDQRGVDIRTRARVEALWREGGSLMLSIGGEGGGSALSVDGVVLAAPACTASPLVAGLSPDAAAELAAIRYASVALVTLAWTTTALPRSLAGSGFLVPRSEGMLLTACTFTSEKWPRSTLSGRAVVRASVGRAGDERASHLTDAELVRRVRQELAAILGISSPPLAHLVKRFPDSFPQYGPGHQGRVARARAALAGTPRVALAGAAFDGIGIPACIESGRRAAAEVLGEPA